MNKVKKAIAPLIWYSGLGALGNRLFLPRRLIIAYHSISGAQNAKELRNDSYSSLSISKEVFTQQIKYIQRWGYTFVYFRDLLSRDGGKTAAIYFDDGFRDVLTNAHQILKNEQIPATLFLTTDYLDQKKDPGVYITWGEAKRMGDLFEFGSHSVTHRKLNKILIEEAREEMRVSKEKIEKTLGTRVTSFSYPKGRSSQTLETVAHEVGYTLTTADPRFHKVRPDPDDSMAVFYWKVLSLW